MHTGKNEIECGLLTANGVLGDRTVTHRLTDGVLKLRDEMFDEDALIMDGKGINTITLRNSSDASVFAVEI